MSASITRYASAVTAGGAVSPAAKAGTAHKSASSSASVSAPIRFMARTTSPFFAAAAAKKPCAAARRAQNTKKHREKRFLQPSLHRRCGQASKMPALFLLYELARRCAIGNSRFGTAAAPRPFRGSARGQMRQPPRAARLPAPFGDFFSRNCLFCPQISIYCKGNLSAKEKPFGNWPGAGPRPCGAPWPAAAPVFGTKHRSPAGFPLLEGAGICKA